MERFIDIFNRRHNPRYYYAQKKTKKEKTKSKTRRVKTGIVPDFAFTGEGVKVSDMLENSPASKAGIKVGDIIVKVNSNQVLNLRDYSDILKSRKPGDVITVGIKRNNEFKLIKLKLEER